MTRPILSACLLVSVAAFGPAQPILYNAALGTAPDAQCFTLMGSAGPVSVVDGALHAGPTSVPQSLWYERTDFPIDLTAGFVMESSVKVVTSDCGQATPTLPWPRYGYQMAVTDDAGRFVVAQLCSTGVTLANDPSAPVDGVNVVTAAYPVAGNPLQVAVVCSAAGATLLLDGAPILTIPLGPPMPFSRNVYFGDGTGSAGSEYFLFSYRCTGSAPGCASGGVSDVTCGCPGLGPLTVTGQPLLGQPITLSVPGAAAGGVPLLLIGPYELQDPLCGPCRLGTDFLDGLLLFTDTISVTLTTPLLTGIPFAVQGARVNGAGLSCAPLLSLSDIAVVVFN